MTALYIGLALLCLVLGFVAGVMLRDRAWTQLELDCSECTIENGHLRSSLQFILAVTRNGKSGTAIMISRMASEALK